MLIRATIVLLVVLNLGVAAWWAWREPPVEPVATQPPGVPRLVLLEEIELSPEPAPPVAADSEAVPEPEPEPQPERENEPAVPVARQASQDAAEPATPPAEEPRRPPAPESLAGEPRCAGAGEDAGGSRGWRVYLEPMADLATAEATARRIAEAGFSDYLVLRDGEHANGIALGMYSTEASAQRRSAALRGKGFPARCARIPASTPA